MSVTFSIESLPTGSFVIDCYDEQGVPVVVAQADSYEAILVERAAHMLTCEECVGYGCYTRPVLDIEGDLDVNVANTNARVLLDALGVDGGDDLCGSVEAEQFLGAVLLAMASDRDDSGVHPVNVAPGATGATMIDCGLRAGYFADRFASLHALATEAVRLGRSVVFS